MKGKNIVLKFILFIVKAAVIVLSATLASLAFPGLLSPDGFPFLAFIYLIPVFYIINKSSVGSSLFYGLIYGFFLYLLYNYWLKTFHPVAIYIAPAVKSLQFMLLFGFLSGAQKLGGKRYYILQALIFTAFFYLTSIGFLAYPYGNIATAIYKMLPFIQSASIFGIWGLDLILILPQALIAYMLNSKVLVKKDILIIAAIFIVNIIFGYISIYYYDGKTPDRQLKIAAIQQNADTWEGGAVQYNKNVSTLIDQSKLALAEDPNLDMIAWAETAVVPSLAWYMNDLPGTRNSYKLVDKVLTFADEISIPLVTGNPTEVVIDNGIGPLNKDGSRNRDIYNSVLLFNDGEIVSTYRKQHLVPFTEYFPYEEEWPKISAYLNSLDLHWWEVGTHPVIFEHDGIKFATPICFEDTFGSISSEFVSLGADFLLNTSNDFWSESVQAEVQHLQLAIFRAIENRVPMLRCTNSGVSCLVSSTGEIISPMPCFTPGYEIYTLDIDLDKHKTLYTLFSDYFAYLTILLSIILVICRIKNIKEEQYYNKYKDILKFVSDEC